LVSSSLLTHAKSRPTTCDGRSRSARAHMHRGAHAQARHPRCPTRPSATACAAQHLIRSSDWQQSAQMSNVVARRAHDARCSGHNDRGRSHPPRTHIASSRSAQERRRLSLSHRAAAQALDGPQSAEHPAGAKRASAPCPPIMRGRTDHATSRWPCALSALAEWY